MEGPLTPTGTLFGVVEQMQLVHETEEVVHQPESPVVGLPNLFRRVGLLHVDDPDELGQRFHRKYLLGTN
jgi:hypothetical protein